MLAEIFLPSANTDLPMAFVFFLVWFMFAQSVKPSPVPCTESAFSKCLGFYLTWPLLWWLLWKPNVKYIQTYHFQGLKIIPSFQERRDSPHAFRVSAALRDLETPCDRQMTLKSVRFPVCLLGAASLPILTSSRPGDILMMAISFLEKANEQCSDVGIPMHNCIESECQSQDSHPGLSGSESSFPTPKPPPYVLSLNCTAGFMEVSAIFLSLFWGSFPTPAASQKANYACQWPVSSNRISDGYGAISASAPLCPELSSQEALAVWQQVVSAACFATLSAQTAYFKPFCDTSLTYLPWIPLLPFLSLSQRPASHNYGNSQGIKEE